MERVVDENGSYACRDLPDGRHACVMPLTFGRARLVVVADLEFVHYLYDDGW